MTWMHNPQSAHAQVPSRKSTEGSGPIVWRVMHDMDAQPANRSSSRFVMVGCLLGLAGPGRVG